MLHPDVQARPGFRGQPNSRLAAILSRSFRPDEGLPFKTLLITAAVQLGMGSIFLALTCLSAEPVAYRGWAGAIMLTSAIVQGKLALKAFQQQHARRGNIFRRTRFWRTMFVGLVVCYLAALVPGPDLGTPYAFAAAVSVWYSFMLLPIAANPQVLETWKRLAQRKILRRSAAVVYYSLAFAVASELSLRGYALIVDSPWCQAITSRRWQATFASAGMLGRPASVDIGSRFHVAIVGDEVTFGSIRNDGALSQLEVLVPGVRVTNFSVPNVGPREYAQDLAQRVIDCRPDLVLTFISVGDDILAESAGWEWFDWHSLHLSRLTLARHFAKPLPAKSAPFSDADSYLRVTGRELSVCRTPVDGSTDGRWQKALQHLDGLVRNCQRSQVDLALVLVPSEFQVNRVLLETLCRRMGYAEKQIDLELPQRRLATFAGDRQVPYVDLLPHLRLCQEPPYERSTRQWNAEGTAVALRTVGGWIQSRYAAIIPATGQVSRQ